MHIQVVCEGHQLCKPSITLKIFLILEQQYVIFFVWLAAILQMCDRKVNFESNWTR